MVPIFKNKRSPDDCGNYRPISILPVLSKIFESVLKFQIVDYFERGGLFLHSQFGFCNKKSTTLAIDMLIHHVTESFEKGFDTYASFYDLTKAFDCISHSILLENIIDFQTVAFKY